MYYILVSVVLFIVISILIINSKSYENFKSNNLNRPLEFRIPNILQQPLGSVSNHLSSKQLNTWINNYDREVKQVPERVSTYTPVAFNDNVKNSNAIKNKIKTFEDKENTKLQKSINYIVHKSEKINLNNYNFREIFSVTTENQEKIIEASKWFIDLVNSHPESNGQWKYLDREDSKMFQAIPKFPLTKSNKIITRFDTVLFMYNELLLITKGINIRIIKEEISGKRPKLYLISANLIVNDNGNTNGIEGFVNLSDKMYQSSNYFEINKDYESTKVTDDMIQSELDKRKRQKTTEQYQCYGSIFVNARTKEQCDRTNGKWDTTVKSSTECPYYQANKNYTNDRGGVIGGYKCAHPIEGEQKCKEWIYGGTCEMPAGVQKIGYRFTNPDSKPLCYNCLDGFYGPKSIGYCCNDQLDPVKYPTLSSPDFVFTNDQPSRLKYNDQLLQRDLSYHPKGKM